jgi:hypothetical protein
MAPFAGERQRCAGLMVEDRAMTGEDQVDHGSSHLLRGTVGDYQEGEDAICQGVGAEMDA